MIRAEASTLGPSLQTLSFFLWSGRPFEGHRDSLSAEFRIPQLGQETKSEREEWVSSGSSRRGENGGQGQSPPCSLLFFSTPVSPRSPGAGGLS